MKSVLFQHFSAMLNLRYQMQCSFAFFLLALSLSLRQHRNNTTVLLCYDIYYSFFTLSACRSSYDVVLYSMMFIISELLLHILSYIPIRTLMTVISHVCKRWYILASDTSLWRHLYVPAESSIDPHWLCYVASRCPLLKSLSIRGNVLNKFNTL